MTRSTWGALALAMLAFLAWPHAAGAAGLNVQQRTLKASSSDYEIDCAWPHTGVKAIDDELAAWVKQEAADFKTQSAPDPDSAAGAYTLDISYEVARNDAKGFAVLFTESTYTGGAHPNHDFIAFNYLMPDAWHVQLPEILDGSKALERLSALVTTDLTRQFREQDGATEPEWDKSGAGPEWSHFATFVLLPDALRIVFPPYQVASYAAGEQESRIPLSALRGVVRADWRAPVASFDCTKAATPVERAICADVPLARLDRDVAQAYGERLANVDSAADKEAIRKRQRTWLGNRNGACTDQTALAACLTGVYRTRLAELAAPR